jgi:hypothetical protein
VAGGWNYFFTDEQHDTMAVLAGYPEEDHPDQPVEEEIEG